MIIELEYAASTSKQERKSRMLYAAVDSIMDFINGLVRKNLRRGSPVWNFLRNVREAVAFLPRAINNTLNQHRWASNARRFEQLIEAYSEEYSKGPRPFYVMQIGAFDGVMDDPIHKWIKKYGWHGILVEPQRNEFERLKENYTDVAENLNFENVAIADSNGQRPFYKVKDEKLEHEWQRMVATLIPPANREDFETEMIETVTFETLLKRYEVDRIDLLQIDVEGYDYELLRLFDFEMIKPRLIRYEHRHLGLSDKRSSKAYLARNGYDVREMRYDTTAVLRDG